MFLYLCFMNLKTAFIMVSGKNVKVLLCAVVLLCTLSGCDWVKKQLGMATSEDIEKLRIEMEQKALREKRIKDSIEAVRLDSIRLANEQSQMPYAKLDKRYYVIVGSFKVDSNAGVMQEQLHEMGYSPVRIPLKNGFDMVAVAGSDDINEARKEITKIEDSDVCPYDVWIYDVQQGLHE